MAVPVAVPRLVGTCNRCGLCCLGSHEGRVIVCEHLVYLNRLGVPDASRCRVYRERVDGMDIRMVDLETFQLVRWATCAKDSDTETRVIMDRIGHGCSLAVEEEED